MDWKGNSCTPAATFSPAAFALNHEQLAFLYSESYSNMIANNRRIYPQA
jgi:hypothetical protein